MSSLLTLPPRFLLPAWSGLQLSQWRALHATASRSLDPSIAPRSAEKPATPRPIPGPKKRLIRRHLADSDGKYSEINNEAQAVRRAANGRRDHDLHEDSFDVDGYSDDVEPYIMPLGKVTSARVAKLSNPKFMSRRTDYSNAALPSNASGRVQSQPSLFEELFPSEARRERERLQPSSSHEPSSAEPQREHTVKKESTSDAGRKTSRNVANSPTPRRRDTILDFVPSPLQKVHWQQDRLTIMVIMGLDPLLDETDFQRLLPRGAHIPEWRSPGDVLRVITARYPDTLAPRATHYLVFANPTVARAYKAYVEHVHALARKHTPTSLLSDPLPPAGYFMQGINLHQLLQDYTLCPPSQDLQIRVLLPPYDSRLRTLLAEQGYAALQRTEPKPKAGRSALLWVDGYTPTTAGIHALLSADGRARGMAWGAKTAAGSIVEVGRSERGEHGEHHGEREHRTTRNSQAAQADEVSNGTGDGTEPSTASTHRRPAPSSPLATSGAPPRWLLTFADETEARRFVRAWHRRPYPFAHRSESARRFQRGDVVPVVQVQFVW